MRRPQDFSAAVRRSPRTRRAAHGSLVVHIETRDPRDGDGRVGPALVGLVVSRAVGSAVTRNLVRRRLRHALREHLHELPEGSLLVVRANPEAAAASWSILTDDLEVALRRSLGTGRRRAGRGVVAGP